jgi:hypothetical protein
MLQKGLRAFKCSYRKEIECEGGRKGRHEGLERSDRKKQTTKKVGHFDIIIYYNIVIDAAEKSIAIDNGELQLCLNGAKMSVKNGSKSLFTLLDTHFQNVMNMKTVDSPVQHVVSPDAIAKIMQDKTDLVALLEA